MAEPGDVFAAWERQFADEDVRAATASRAPAPLWFRLLLGAALGLALVAAAAVARAVLILAQVFGSAGGYVITVRLLIYSVVGGVVGAFVAYAWPQLIRSGKWFVAALVAIVLLGPAALQYVEARTGHLSSGELHELAASGGRETCVIALPARDGWPAGTYWMLDWPTMTGTLVTKPGGDTTWLHRFPAPMVCPGG